MIGSGATTRRQRSTRTLRDGSVLRRDETRKAHPPECAWCRSEDRVQRVGIVDRTRPGPWDHRHETVVAVCPEHLWLAFAIDKGELHGPFA